LIVAEGLMECYDNFKAFIHLLKTAGRYERAQEIFKTIVPYFEKLSKQDLNLVIEISINNRQICDAADCSTIYIPKLLEVRKDDIEPTLMNKIVSQIE
jgi:hypothetical protein